MDCANSLLVQQHFLTMQQSKLNVPNNGQKATGQGDTTEAAWRMGILRAGRQGTWDMLYVECIRVDLAAAVNSIN